MVTRHIDTQSNQPLSLYFHFPFCKKKCPYCHFFVLSHAQQKEELFLKSLEIEWGLKQSLMQNKKIVSLYFGGGTPTLCVKGIVCVLKWAKHLLDRNAEITVEANPEDITPLLINRLLEIGVNRLSIGVQSLEDSLLRILGRTHTSQKAIDALYIAERQGLSNLSIDLMYELPSQTLAMWNNTLKQIRDLPITHLSLYNLTIEPNTLFDRKRSIIKPQLPSEEEGVAMLTRACDLFHKKGLQRYEISAFAKKGSLSIHNTGYWIGRPFLGFGPSAFSYLNGIRSRNAAHFNHYIKKLEDKQLPVDFEEKLPYPANVHELLMLHLRLIAGVNLEEFETNLGPLPLTAYHLLRKLDDQGLISYQKPHVALTEKGRLFYDYVAEELILI